MICFMVVLSSGLVTRKLLGRNRETPGSGLQTGELLHGMELHLVDWIHESESGLQPWKHYMQSWIQGLNLGGFAPKTWSPFLVVTAVDIPVDFV